VLTAGVEVELRQLVRNAIQYEGVGARVDFDFDGMAVVEDAARRFGIACVESRVRALRPQVDRRLDLPVSASSPVRVEGVPIGRADLAAIAEFLSRSDDRCKPKPEGKSSCSDSKNASAHVLLLELLLRFGGQESSFRLVSPKSQRPNKSCPNVTETDDSRPSLA